MPTPSPRCASTIHRYAPYHGSPRLAQRQPAAIISPAAYDHAPSAAASRRLWTPAEDEKVQQLVALYGKAWTLIAQHTPGRSSKQCRERWHNHLNTSISKEAWSVAEERMVVELQRAVGNKWSQIAKYLACAGHRRRTDNDIKNHYNTMLRRGEAIEHLLVDGELPSSFPGGEIPPPPTSFPRGTAEEDDDEEEGELARPSGKCPPPQFEAVAISSMLRAAPKSSLAQLVEAHTDDLSMAHRSPSAQVGLDALVSMVLATNRAQLLDATSRLKEVLKEAVVNASAGGDCGDGGSRAEGKGEGKGEVAAAAAVSTSSGTPLPSTLAPPTPGMAKLHELLQLLA